MDWNTIILSTFLSAVVGIIIVIIFRFIIKLDIQKVFEKNYDHAIFLINGLVLQDYIIMKDIYDIIDVLYDEQKEVFEQNIVTNQESNIATSTILTLGNRREEIQNINTKYNETMNNFLDSRFIETYLGKEIIYEISKFILITHEFNNELLNNEIFSFVLLQERRDTLKELVDELNLFRHVESDIMDEWKHIFTVTRRT